MVHSYELGIYYRNFSVAYTKEFKDCKSLEEAFKIAYKILEAHDKSVILLADLTYSVAFAPVPDNCADCNMMEFDLLDNRYNTDTFQVYE